MQKVSNAVPSLGQLLSLAATGRVAPRAVTAADLIRDSRPSRRPGPPSLRRPRLAPHPNSSVLPLLWARAGERGGERRGCPVRSERW